MRSITHAVKTTVVLAIVLMMTFDTANACRLLNLLSRDDGSCGCESTVSTPIASAPFVSTPIVSAPIVSAPIVVESAPIVESFPIVASLPIVESAPIIASAPVYSEPIVSAAPSSDCCCCCDTGVVTATPVMDGTIVESGPIDDGYVEGGFASPVVTEGGFADFPVINDGQIIEEAMPTEVIGESSTVVEGNYDVVPDSTIIESPVETITPASGRGVA